MSPSKSARNLHPRKTKPAQSLRAVASAALSNLASEHIHPPFSVPTSSYTEFQLVHASVSPSIKRSRREMAYPPAPSNGATHRQLLSSVLNFPGTAVERALAAAATTNAAVFTIEEVVALVNEPRNKSERRLRREMRRVLKAEMGKERALRRNVVGQYRELVESLEKEMDQMERALQRISSVSVVGSGDDGGKMKVKAESNGKKVGGSSGVVKKGGRIVGGHGGVVSKQDGEKEVRRSARIRKA